MTRRSTFVTVLVLVCGLISSLERHVSATPIGMYWTDTTADSIRRSDLDGLNELTVLPSLSDPRIITLDLTAEKMYWGTATSPRIQRANLDGTGLEDLVTNPLFAADLRGIQLDLVNNQMYWIDSNNKEIYRANLDIPAGQDAFNRTDIEVLRSGVLEVGSGEGLALVIPEPSAFTLAGLGLIGLFVYGWRRRCSGSYWSQTRHPPKKQRDRQC